MKRSSVIAFAAFFVMTVMAKDLAALTWNLWYLANKAYVAAELCENKPRPEMQCNGKCHLAKQLEKLEEPAPAKQKTPAHHAAKLKENSWITTSGSPAIPGELLFAAETDFNGWVASAGTLRSFSALIFHPPASA